MWNDHWTHILHFTLCCLVCNTVCTIRMGPFEICIVCTICRDSGLVADYPLPSRALTNVQQGATSGLRLSNHLAIIKQLEETKDYECISQILEGKCFRLLHHILLLFFLHSLNLDTVLSKILEGKYPLKCSMVCTIVWCQIQSLGSLMFLQETCKNAIPARIIKTMISPAHRVSTTWYWPAEFREGACSIVTDTLVFTLGWRGANNNGQGG